MNKKSGLFHFYNNVDKTTKYKMAEFISNFLQKTNNVAPVDVLLDMATRPIDTQLIDDQYDINKYIKTTIESGLVKCFSNLRHPKLIKHQNDVIVLVDLDGTLVDTDKMHCECYLRVLADMVSYRFDKQKCMNALMDNTLDDFINNCLHGLTFSLSEVKTKKNELLKKINKINLNPGAEKFIEYLSTVNHVIVTNTSQDVVEHFKLICPQLQMLTNWVTKEDYSNPKPDPEPYVTAINKYKKSDQYIIGIENTYAGYLSLQHVTKCIYIMNNLDDPRLSDSDVYLINNFDSVF